VTNPASRIAFSSLREVNRDTGRCLSNNLVIECAPTVPTEPL